MGTSRDTSEFACACIKNWWLSVGKGEYRRAKAILILCDGGGSNSSRAYIFKQDLENLACELGINIRIAHYPPYCSKYNPIEHRLFPHITHAIRGANYTSVEMLAQAINRARTKTGISVVVYIDENSYEIKRKYRPGYKDNNAIKYHRLMPKWNYTAIAA